MANTEIKTKDAPIALGPYSQAIKNGPYTFCSGQTPINPETNEVVEGTIAEQTRQVFENLKAVLKAANLEMSNIVKTTVYLTDMSTFTEMNEVYAEFFKKPYPARATVEVAGLPKGAGVEIDAIAC